MAKGSQMCPARPRIGFDKSPRKCTGKQALHVGVYVCCRAMKKCVLRSKDMRAAEQRRHMSIPELPNNVFWQWEVVGTSEDHNILHALFLSRVSSMSKPPLSTS